MTTMTAVKRYSAEALHSQIISILVAWGMPQDAAAITADSMVDTDLSGIDSHGVSMLMTYESMFAAGRLKLTARPEVVVDLPGFAVIDGNNGFGHPTGLAAIRLAIEKARVNGIGAVAVRNSNHFGALGYYVRQAANESLVALGTTTARTPVTSATGGTAPVLGTNPIAFTAPRTDGKPLVVDMSTSVVAMNKVKAYALKGLDLPVGWLIDREGNDITDAALGYQLLTTRGATISVLGGATPETGGHKGFGLSLMVQVLSGALSNAAVPGHGGDTDNVGHFFLVIDPELVNPGNRTAENVEALLRSVQDGEPNVIIPGQPEEHSRRERSVDGIPIPESLMTFITDICARCNVPLTLAPLPADRG